jgi:hypothetical protein
MILLRSIAARPVPVMSYGSSGETNLVIYRSFQDCRWCNSVSGIGQSCCRTHRSQQQCPRTGRSTTGTGPLTVSDCVVPLSVTLPSSVTTPNSTSQMRGSRAQAAAVRLLNTQYHMVLIEAAVERVSWGGGRMSVCPLSDTFAGEVPRGGGVWHRFRLHSSWIEDRGDTPGPDMIAAVPHGTKSGDGVSAWA